MRFVQVKISQPRAIVFRARIDTSLSQQVNISSTVASARSAALVSRSARNFLSAKLDIELVEIVE
jgi:hypothetical protein